MCSRVTSSSILSALTIFVLTAAMSAQTLRSPQDPRNQAPTVGTGGPVGGPTGLFTVYDGDTIRKYALDNGMVTLRQAGLRQCVKGNTTLEEVMAVVADQE